MNVAASDLWSRAVDAFGVARHDLPVSPDATASRAYYAAFYAVSARFALEARTFSRHSEVEAAVHRDLVRTGIWTKELGSGFSRLSQLRARGDYGGSRHVSEADAAEAVRIASDILRAVGNERPDAFAAPDEPEH